jgi:integrase
MLTEAAVRRYKSTGERRIIRDAGARSLYLIIEKSGSKSWMMRFRRPGDAAAKMVLGPLDLSGREIAGEIEVGMPLSLTAARALAARIHRDRAMGRDPIADHKARRHRQRAAIEERGSFAAAARAFIEEHAKVRTRRWQETARGLGLDPETLEPVPGGLAERWADRDARAIDPHDVWSATDEARRIGIPGVVARNEGARDSRARVLHAALSSAFGWMQRRRLVDANPCSGVPRPAPARARDRVFTSAEIVKFWGATEVVGGPFGGALRLLLLTGCRLNEIAGLRWDEISEGGAEIRLPGNRTKNHRPHVVPLSPPAREIIASAPRVEGCDFVFSTNGKTPISGWSKAKAQLDALMGDPAPWRIHDLRRTAVTGMAELGIRPDVIELSVNHVSGARAGVAGTYNRSEMMPERRAALERWALHLAGVVAGEAPAPADLESERRRRRART